VTAVREQILLAVEAALGATGAVEIERMPSGDPSQFDALQIFDDGQADVPQTEIGSVRYQMNLGIVGFVEGGSGSAASAALNALYSKTVAAIMPLEDPALGIEEIVERNMQVKVAKLASKRRLSFELDFEITFVTRRGNPETF